MNTPLEGHPLKSAEGSSLGTMCRLTAGNLEAIFLPDRGMLGASLRHGGAELLRRVEDLESSARKGSTAGIPLLHPWANRLAGFRYRVGGHDVTLEESSLLLHRDVNGLPIHGVSWPCLKWQVEEQMSDRLAASLAWDRADLLAIFPFRHRLQFIATLSPGSLTIETTLTAISEERVPVSFGFHPYFGLPGVDRSVWHLQMPAMRRLLLDVRGLPTGGEESFAKWDGPLGERVFDDGFAILDEQPSFVLAGGGRRLTVTFLTGYRFAQIFAPPGQDYVALEPMTAPTNALVNGRGLSWAVPGQPFRAAFRIQIESVL